MTEDQFVELIKKDLNSKNMLLYPHQEELLRIIWRNPHSSYFSLGGRHNGKRVILEEFRIFNSLIQNHIAENFPEKEAANDT